MLMIQRGERVTLEWFNMAIAIHEIMYILYSILLLVYECNTFLASETNTSILIEGVRVRVSQPSITTLAGFCSIRTFRTYLKENRQELYI